ALHAVPGRPPAAVPHPARVPRARAPRRDRGGRGDPARRGRPARRRLEARGPPARRAADRRGPDAAGRRRDGAHPPRRPARRPARPRARLLQAAAALRAAVRPRHGPGAVAPRADADAAGRLAHEDDDRARRRRRGPARREGPHPQGGPRLPRIGLRRPEAGQAHRDRHDAPRAAAALRQRRGDRPRAAHGGQRPGVRPAHEPQGRRHGADLHALLLPRRLPQPRQPLVHARPRGDRARRAADAAPRADRPAARGGAALPDPRRAGVPLQQQPAPAPGLPGHHGHEDGLHGRRRALPGGDRAAREDPPGGGPARLPGPGAPGHPTARSRLPRDARL
ncbi:MAG: D-alanyl-D-alanine carboxypeptidase, partial [uncultured Solirubrobacteraceae bacterium]